MTDPRWKQLASSLINRSLGVKPGERLLIAMIEVECYPLALAAYEACVKAGGYAQVLFMSEAMKHALLRYGTDEQIAWVPEIEAYGMDWADHYLALRGAFNLGECYDIPDAKVAAYQKAMGKISTLRWQKTNWTLVRVPNERFAQQAG
ncbi:MAG TPA: aminopeptidase, partial [Clostridia bacterium]|nr:aminopeptidase [Clostridia bacterium]